MLERQGNIWYRYRGPSWEWVAFSTNSVVKHDGRLTMDTGFAKAVKEKWPLRDLDLELGQYLNTQGLNGKFFGALAVPIYRIVAFQSKTDYQLPSGLEMLDLLERSAYELMKLLDEDGLWDVYTWTGEPQLYEGPLNMVRPGCGLEGLDWAQVRPVLADILSDRVIIWNL